MVEYMFRLTGVPPTQAIKIIDIDVSQRVSDAKKRVQRAYKLNPIRTIQIIHKGKILIDTLKFASLGIHPKKDVITVISTQSGGNIKTQIPTSDDSTTRHISIFENNIRYRLTRMYHTIGDIDKSESTSKCSHQKQIQKTSYINDDYREIWECERCKKKIREYMYDKHKYEMRLIYCHDPECELCNVLKSEGLLGTL